MQANVTSIIQTNVLSTVSINSDSKKVRHKMNCYILHTFLLLDILLLLIAIICYHYIKIRSKQTKYSLTNNTKMEKNNEF